MRVVVGSRNIPKRNATEASFKAAFPNEEIAVETVNAESGVCSHPISSEESLKGALNRAVNASKLVHNADYQVGIEGGLLVVADRAWEIGWIAVRHSSGKISTGLSAGMELGGKILKAVLGGEELSEILKNCYGIESAGNRNGFFGLGTNDLVTRQSAYEQGITFALAPFLHPEFYGD